MAGRLSAAEIRGLQAKRKAALKKKKQTKLAKADKGQKWPIKADKADKADKGRQQERTKVMVTKEQDKFPAVEPTGAKTAAKAPNIGQPTIVMKERGDGRQLGKGMADHVQGILKKHEPANPTLPSPTEVAVRALGLRCLQLLAEAEAIAEQIELYEVPEEDEEKRKEAKANAAKAPKEHQGASPSAR